MPSLKINCSGCGREVRVPTIRKSGYAYKTIRTMAKDENGQQRYDADTGLPVELVTKTQKNPSGKVVVGPRYTECRPCYLVTHNRPRPVGDR
jgi:hypothetical protein